MQPKYLMAMITKHGWIKIEVQNQEGKGSKVLECKVMLSLWVSDLAFVCVVVVKSSKISKEIGLDVW